MRKLSSGLCPLALLAANCCAMAGLFTVFSLVERMEKHDPCLTLWLLCLALCYVGLKLFLRRERSARAVIYFCGASFLLQLVLAFVVYGWFSSFVGVLISVCMWLYSYYGCYEMCIKTPAPERYTKSFDLCAIVLVFLLFFCSVKKLSLSIVLPLAVSTLLCLLALVLVRGGEGRKMRSILISGGLVALMLLLSGGFVLVASGGMKKLVTVVVDFLYAVVSFISRCINAAFLFLLRLFPTKEIEGVMPPELESMELGNIQEPSFELVDPEKLMIALLCIGLAAAAALVILHIVNGKHRIPAASLGGSDKIKRQRSGLFVALRRAMKKLGAGLRFKLICVTQRNTAPGLFIQIERHSRPQLHGRGEGESCREFLKRAIGVYPQAQAELMQLADILDSLHFGAGDNSSAYTIASLRKKIFSAEN